MTRRIILKISKGCSTSGGGCIEIWWHAKIGYDSLNEKNKLESNYMKYGYIHIEGLGNGENTYEISWND